MEMVLLLNEMSNMSDANSKIMALVVCLLGIIVIQMFVLLRRIKVQNRCIEEILRFMVTKDPEVADIIKVFKSNEELKSITKNDSH